MPWWRVLLGRRAVGTLAALTAAVLMAGCTSNPEPAPLPSPSASGSESAGASPSASASAAPSMPAEARGTSKKSAKAFVRYYVDVLNHAMATGDTELLESLSSPKCVSCDSVAQLVNEVYSAGGHISSQGWSLHGLSVVHGRRFNEPVIDAALVFSPQHVVRSAGAKVERFDGGRAPATFYLRSAANGWRVIRLDRSA
jgi:choline/glycine/proline betaine transport protein